jgi:hypothetical protein
MQQISDLIASKNNQYSATYGGLAKGDQQDRKVAGKRPRADHRWLRLQNFVDDLYFLFPKALASVSKVGCLTRSRT